MPSQLSRLWPWAWGAGLVALVTWPFFLPGEFLWRDMAVLHHMGFTPANFGGGDLPARNAPQDGVLALASLFISATWVARVAVVGAATAAAWAGWALSKSTPALGMAIAVINPFVVERLLQGQWSLAVAAWLLPLIAAAGLRGHRALAWSGMFVASLTPTGALLALATALASMRHRVATLVLGGFFSLPWLIPGLLGPAAPTNPAAGVAAFAPRAEPYVGTLGALLELGGIWNAAALPETRALGAGVFGLFVVLCIFTRLHRVPAPLLALAAGALIIPLLSWITPQILTQAIEAIPGLGIARDAQKFIILALPAYAVALGDLRLSRRLIYACAVALFLQMPDAAQSLSVLTPRDSGVDHRLVAQLDGRTTLFVDQPTLVEVPGGVAVDPYSKAAAKLESGELTVDGKAVDLPTARATQARTAWEAGDMGKLEELGIGKIVQAGRVVAETNAPAPRVPWALTLLWLLGPLAIAAAALWTRAPATSGQYAPKKNPPQTRAH